MKNLLPIIFIFLGEFLVIVAEMSGSFLYNKYSTIKFFTVEFLLLVIGGFLLVFGYIKGLQLYGNIWKVSVCSITTLLIIEPSIALIFFKQTPDIRTAAGFILGVIGLLITI